jgi:hypothetical protein
MVRLTRSVELPLASVIFRVSQDASDIDLTPLEVNHADQAVSVPKDIEHGEFSHLIGMLESGADVAEASPLSSFGNLKPGT